MLLYYISNMTDAGYVTQVAGHILHSQAGALQFFTSSGNLGRIEINFYTSHFLREMLCDSDSI